jgi:hypothetical protein
MKTFFIAVLVTLTISPCFGQKYDVWMNTTRSLHVEKGTFKQFNDSAITIQTYAKLLRTIPLNPLYFPGKLKVILWDEVNTLKIRNNTRNSIGTSLGAIVGLGAGILISASGSKGQDTSGNIGMGLASAYAKIIITGFTMSAGALTGYLVTSAKITIPLQGKKAREKSQALRDYLSKKK